MEDLGEIVGEFLMESHENLDQIDRDLVDLDRQQPRATGHPHHHGRAEDPDSEHDQHDTRTRLQEHDVILDT